MGIEKVAEFSSQLSRVLLTLGHGFRNLQATCNKTEDQVIDLKEQLKRTRTKLEVLALGKSMLSAKNPLSMKPPNTQAQENAQEKDSTEASLEEGEETNEDGSSKGGDDVKVIGKVLDKSKHSLGMAKAAAKAAALAKKLKSARSSVVAEIENQKTIATEFIDTVVQDTAAHKNMSGEEFENQPLDEKFRAVESRLRGQNKINELMVKALKADPLSMIYNAFVAQISLLEGELTEQRESQAALFTTVESLKETVTKQDKVIQKIKADMAEFLGETDEGECQNCQLYLQYNVYLLLHVYVCR